MCEIIFCLGLYLSGSVGHQFQDQEMFEFERSNHYGTNVGMGAIGFQFENGLFIEARHISGLNTSEDDQGMNAVLVGIKIMLWESK